MRPRLGSALAISLALISCGAKNAATRITVKVADNYSGSLRLDTCAKDTHDPVLIDKNGNGLTSACPMDGDVEILVVKSSRTIYISREKITVARVGDGFPVAIFSSIP
jgi:hypothetical protein